MSDYQLRPYQSDLRDRIFHHLHAGDRTLLQLCTGGGKTIIFGSVAAQFVTQQKRVLVLAHREELVTQAATKLAKQAGCPAGIIKAGYEPNPEAPIQVASVQTLTRRPGAAGDIDLIITDEAHHASAATYRAIYQRHLNAQHLGVTATPIRTDGSGFDGLFDVLLCGLSVQWH